MLRWSIAKARVAWIVGGCSGCGVFVRTIASNVRFHSITAFGGAASAVLGAGVEGAVDRPSLGGDWARAEGAATAEARSPASTESLDRFIGVPLCGGWAARYDILSSYAA